METATETPRKYLSPGALLEATYDEAGIGLCDLWSHSRHENVVRARMALVAVARRRTLMSFPQINKKLLGRPSSGHSTSVTAFRRFGRDADKRGADGRTLAALADSIEAAADWSSRGTAESVVAVGAWRTPTAGRGAGA